MPSIPPKWSSYLPSQRTPPPLRRKPSHSDLRSMFSQRVSERKRKCIAPTRVHGSWREKRPWSITHDIREDDANAVGVSRRTDRTRPHTAFELPFYEKDVADVQQQNPPHVFANPDFGDLSPQKRNTRIDSAAEILAGTPLNVQQQKDALDAALAIVFPEGHSTQTDNDVPEVQDHKRGREEDSALTHFVVDLRTSLGAELATSERNDKPALAAPRKPFETHKNTFVASHVPLRRRRHSFDGATPATRDLQAQRKDIIRIVRTRNMSRPELSLRREIFHQEQWLRTHKADGGTIQYRQIAVALGRNRRHLFMYKRRGHGWRDLPLKVRNRIWEMAVDMDAEEDVQAEDDVDPDEDMAAEMSDDGGVDGEHGEQAEAEERRRSLDGDQIRLRNGW